VFTKLKATAVVVGVALMGIAPTHAAVIKDTTPTNLYPSTVPGVQTAFISNTFVTANTPFDDLWTFDVTGARAQGGSSATALSTVFSGSFNQQQIPLTLSLVAWDSANGAYDTIIDTSAGIAPKVQGNLPAQPAGSGSGGHGFYGILVTGITPAGAAVTQYSGQIQVTAAPAPEPEIYALLALGLGAVVWQRGRRNRNV
jgi:hypothetical protein